MSDEREEAEERTSPTSKVVYEAIFSEGSDELERSSSALAWSGLAAGLSMGFSFLAVALIRAFLPDSPWVPLVSSFGYTLGFLIVILGRQQLFTENTLTVILPLMRRRDGQTFGNVMRLWGIVLAANVLGAALFGLVLARTQAVEPHVYQQLHDTAISSMPASFGEGVLRGVFAGWLIALVVWLLPFAETARVTVIIIVTYVVGLAHLAHVIVQSVEVSFLVFAGYIPVSEAVVQGFLPALIGNIVGGVALVAAINHAQVVGHQGADS